MLTQWQKFLRHTASVALLSSIGFGAINPITLLKAPQTEQLSMYLVWRILKRRPLSRQVDNPPDEK
ncbi:MAG: hypothetical protein OWS74_08930 [Firmicutes bacterium]|nr:hypothetical protein [Bacillota bacterium]